MNSRVSRRYQEWIVVFFASIVFLSGAISPPALMDDVDASQALIARNMLTSGDWVSMRLDGVLFLQKAPLKYWMTAIGYMALGIHDWVARLPGAFSAIALCWAVFRFGRWAISSEAGFYAGLFLSTCAGLYLFTRTTIPDVILTLAITVSIWAFLRALDSEEGNPRWCAYLWAVSLAASVLTKGLIGLLFPLGAAALFLVLTGDLLKRETWQRLHLPGATLIFLAISLPWHVLAVIRNPPYFDFTLHGGPGHYRGFFWFYFINEHLLRFIGTRYPHDYNTVSRPWFWLLNIGWLFPWSVYLPKLRLLSYRPYDRAGRARLMALCWIAFVMVFFTFSTTQEYYSMPIYPALALLLGSAVAGRPPGVLGTRILAVIAGTAALAMGVILILVRNTPAPGDISIALTRNLDAYTLALGHMQDLTIQCFAYLRTPLAVACFACAAGALCAWRLRGDKAIVAIALMMALFFQASRLALVVFDPYLSSRHLAEALKRAPKGQWFAYGDHNDISSLFFYGEDKALLLNGRDFSLEYGSFAPGAPDVFINDEKFARLWEEPQRFYLAIDNTAVPRIAKLVGAGSLHLVVTGGGKSLFVNRPGG